VLAVRNASAGQSSLAPSQNSSTSQIPAEARHWAVRRQSLERLTAEGLARDFAPRSLMRDALPRIGKVLREPGPTQFG
jgi:hypothetical protein